MEYNNIEKIIINYQQFPLFHIKVSFSFSQYFLFFFLLSVTKILQAEMKSEKFFTIFRNYYFANIWENLAAANFVCCCCCLGFSSQFSCPFFIWFFQRLAWMVSSNFLLKKKTNIFMNFGPLILLKLSIHRQCSVIFNNSYTNLNKNSEKGAFF